MIAVKQVPMMPATSAAAAHLGTAAPDRPSPSEFSRFWLEHFSRAVSHDLATAGELTGQIPVVDECSRAFHETYQRTIELTEADGWAGFDTVALTDADEPALSALTCLADDLEARSPLLLPLADALHTHIPSRSAWTLGQVAKVRALVCADAIAAAPEPEVDEQDDRPGPRIRWADVNLLVPGTSERVRRLLDALYADLPDPDPQGGLLRLGRASSPAS